ncbi:putative membrane protein [Synechococcus sp. A18-46.1]|nr:putative membrane protein [Synechococcus sp. A18-46.1]
MALIPRWRFMTDGSKAIVKRAAISALVIFLSLTILRAFFNYIILAVIIYAALQLFNRK